MSPSATTQWPVAQPAPLNTAPLDGECSGQPVLKAKVPPFPQTSDTGQERTPGWLQGPSSLHIQGQTSSSEAVHVDAVNTTVQKCNKHKATKQTKTQISKLERNMGHSLSMPGPQNASCFNRKLFHCSLVGVTTDMF